MKNFVANNIYSSCWS